MSESIVQVLALQKMIGTQPYKFINTCSTELGKETTLKLGGHVQLIEIVVCLTHKILTESNSATFYPTLLMFIPDLNKSLTGAAYR